MSGYSGTPLWRKLGVRPGDTLRLVDAPDAWSVADLPSGVTTAAGLGAKGTDTGAEIIVAFFSTQATLRESVPALAERVFPAGAIWIAWPRRAGGHDSDIRERDIRSVALPLGLVDVKVAALDEHWSGLRLVWRRELRHASKAPRG